MGVGVGDDVDTNYTVRGYNRWEAGVGWNPGTLAHPLLSLVSVVSTGYQYRHWYAELKNV